MTTYPTSFSKNILVIFVTAILVFLGGYFIVHSLFKPIRVGYIKSEVLIYSYEGTKEARIKYDEKRKAWQANIDTLTNNYQRSIDGFNFKVGKLSYSEKMELEKRLDTQRQQIEEYTNAINDKAEKEDEEMMRPVLNQINSFIKSYSIENGYDLVIGTSENGTVLYGKEELDITDIVLKNLNKKYKGE
jgi:outer membrane protein